MNLYETLKTALPDVTHITPTTVQTLIEDDPTFLFELFALARAQAALN